MRKPKTEKTSFLSDMKVFIRAMKINYKIDPVFFWIQIVNGVGDTIRTLINGMGANALNKRQQAMLSSAYAFVQNSYKEYRNKLKELYGEEAHNNITNAIMYEKVKKNSITAVGGFACTSLDFGDAREPEVLRTFYDSFSKRYFETTIEKVIQAEYHLNRNFALGGSVGLEDFYDFLGIECPDFGKPLGWYVDDEFYWIDFNHRKDILEDGTEIFIIDMVYEPLPNDEF